MTWMDRLSALLARKSSRAGVAVAAVGLAPARWTPRRYDRLAEEGYRKNVVAYRCVREVARACASVPWLLYRGQRELDTHPVLDLLRRPNPRQSGPELIEAAIGHLLLSGNAYLEVVRPEDDHPRELYALRPDRMRVVPDVSGVPRAYRYEVEGRTVDWPVDPMTGASDVLHLRDFHPLDDWYGLSPIEAAAASIDQHNAAAEHNAALLQNGARPSGALIFRSDPGPDGIRRVEEALLDRTQGPRQAGRPLVLGGDVEWKELGLSPKDMDFAETKAQAAREISSAFGVPYLLVVSGEATFNNRADARFELWEHTVTPPLDRLSSALSTWLGPMFGADLRLAHDLDEVPALALRRRMKWQQISQAGFLTLNEKRAALGYAPVEGGDGGTEQKNSEDYERIHGRPQPRRPAGEPESGRWVADPGRLLQPTQFRVSRGGGGRRPPPRRPGRSARNDDDGGGRGSPPRNPFPDRPHCVEQWKKAIEECYAEDQRQLNEPWKPGNTRLNGFDIPSCIAGRVSEECGGNPIGGVKNADPDCSGGCSDMTKEHPRDLLPPLLEQASQHSGAGRYEEAVSACTEHLALHPDDARAYSRRAFTLHQLERFEEAVADWDECLAREPGNRMALCRRAESLAGMGLFEEAIQEFNQVEASFPGYNALSIPMFRAFCLIELGRFDEAMADIDRLPDDGGLFTRERSNLLQRFPRNRRGK